MWRVWLFNSMLLTAEHNSSCFCVGYIHASHPVALDKSKPDFSHFYLEIAAAWGKLVLAEWLFALQSCYA